MKGVFTWLAAAAVAALVLAGGADAATQLPAQKHALAALEKAEASEYVDAADAAADRAEIARAGRLIRGLPASRGRPITVALGQIAALSGRLNGPRALAVFGQLRANDDYFSKHYAPADQTDITDADGLVYRYFAGRCLEFHPLANFGALNAAIALKNIEATRKLADALVDRGVHEPGGGVGWEYDFDFEGGRAPWLSGMAQAVAAQALARASALVTTEKSALMGQATAAYQAISSKLLTQVAAGPWIKLYAFTSMPVLNAQLQTVVSLQSYAEASGDTKAASLATRLQTSAAEMLGRFDTGYWSYYSLNGRQSPVDYQQFVVSLLKKLAPADPRFASAAQRFAGYLTEPPAFKLANAGLGQVRFWLSKPSSVQLSSGAGPTKRLALAAGWHTVGWDEPTRAGVYAVTAKATDWAGNSASFSGLPIVRVTTEPKKPTKKKTAAVRGTAAVKAAAVGPSAFSVGVGIDDPSQAPLAVQLGVHLVRMGLVWPAGATTPDPGVLTSLQSLPAGASLVLELFADPLPADDAGLAAIAAYAASLAQQIPALRDLVLEPAPTAATAAAYATALEAIRTAVAAAVPGVAVGASIDGAAAPKTAVAALGRALAGAPLDVVSFLPAPAAAAGDWTAANVPQLTTALTQALGSTPPVLEDGLPSTSPADAAQAVTAAACSPTLAGVILDRLVDTQASTLTAAGLFTAAGTAKIGLPALAAAVAAAQRGTQVCPGVASPAAASDLEVPVSLSGPLSVTLGCTRDCLYLVTLDAADGKPVVATRGALVGGATPAEIALPSATLSAGTYRFDVRLVSQVNPGPVAQLRSDPLSVP